MNKTTKHLLLYILYIFCSSAYADPHKDEIVDYESINLINLPMLQKMKPEIALNALIYLQNHSTTPQTKELYNKASWYIVRNPRIQHYLEDAVKNTPHVFSTGVKRAHLFFFCLI